MNPRIENIGEKKLVGKKIEMSLTDNKTAELWRSFMMERDQIKNRIGNDFISLQNYDPYYFSDFKPNNKFEKWATVEVTDLNNIQDILEPFTLRPGLYAVFHHEGNEMSIFQSIFTEWLPNSEYLLDNRPHFEILGEKYKNGSPDSEEDIWIPIKPKNN